MAESATALSDAMNDTNLDLKGMDFEDVNDSGNDRDVDVEIIDGFYHQNVAFMNNRVQSFADYWMKLYLFDAFSEIMLWNF